MGVYRMKHPTRGFRFYPTAATDAAVRAAALDAYNAGGGEVVVPPGRIQLAAPLPILAGVTYRGTAPRLLPTYVADGAWMPDGPASLSGGTVLVGDGTFAAFEANAGPLGAPGSNPGLAQIEAAGIRDLGIDNVTYGIRVGATNLAGVMWGAFENIAITRATQWGVEFVNSMHNRIRDIRTVDCAGGQRYANDFPQLTLMTGNNQFGELFNVIPRGVAGFLARGIVFEAVQGALNECAVERLQVNAMARTQLVDTLTLTSGTTAISVPDATKYAPRLWVLAGATTGGFTSGVAYCVQSVNTANNTIVLGTALGSGTVTPNASGTLAVTSWGMPCAEIIGLGTGAVVGSGFRHLDLEGAATVALHLENVDRCEFGIFEKPSSGNFVVVGRKARWSSFRSMGDANRDFDANSVSSNWSGSGGTILGRKLPGVHSGGVSLSGGQNGDAIPDLVQGSGGFIYPQAGMGQKVFPRDANWSANAATSGEIVYTSAVARTITLHTIADSTVPQSSHVGLTYEIVNAGTAILTVNTDGTQLFNKTAGLTSLPVAAGTTLRLTAIKDWQNALWWMAQRTTLVTA